MDVWDFGWFVFAAFVLCSWPIVAHDLQDMEVPAAWLFLFLLGLLIVSWGWGADQWTYRAWGSSLVVAGGTLFCWLWPGRLGEADVLYVAGFPFLLGFFSVLFALGLACAAGMALFAWRTLVNRSWSGLPVAFTPLLFWGASAQFLIGGHLT